MDLNTLKSKPRTRTKPGGRKGRGPGSGLGRTAGRGGKGASARSGFSRKFYFEGGQMPLVRRLPKVGFNNALFSRAIVVLNVRSLNEFDDGAKIGPDEFLKAGLINKLADGVKVLGDGDLERKLTVRAHQFSKSARAKIEAKGGKCEVIAAEGKGRSRKSGN
jgi:large subunit ribosomal protein L15